MQGQDLSVQHLCLFLCFSLCFLIFPGVVLRFFLRLFFQRSADLCLLLLEDPFHFLQSLQQLCTVFILQRFFLGKYQYQSFIRQHHDLQVKRILRRLVAYLFLCLFDDLLYHFFCFITAGHKIFIINIVLFQLFVGKKTLYGLIINSFYFHSYHLLLLYV